MGEVGRPLFLAWPPILLRKSLALFPTSCGVRAEGAFISYVRDVCFAGP